MLSQLYLQAQLAAFLLGGGHASTDAIRSAAQLVQLLDNQANPPASLAPGQLLPGLPAGPAYVQGSMPSPVSQVGATMPIEYIMSICSLGDSQPDPTVRQIDRLQPFSLVLDHAQYAHGGSRMQALLQIPCQVQGKKPLQVRKLSLGALS